MACIGGGSAHERFIGDWHALLVLVVAGFLPNEIWRMLGLWLGGGIDEGSELLVWVRAVATAILAGVIAQILVQPPGALASVPGLAALWRGGRRICGLHADAAVDLCRRGLRRSGDAGWQMVARLIAVRPLSKHAGRNGMNSRARSALICCLGIVAAFVAVPAARAAEFPTRPIKLVIPYAAGGPTDIFGRLVAEYLGKDLKQSGVRREQGGRARRHRRRNGGALPSPMATRCSAPPARSSSSIRCCTRSCPTIRPRISGCWRW